MKNKVIIGLIILALFISPFIRSFILKNFPNKESLTLVIGTTAKYPPFTFIEKGEIVGFDIDLIYEIAKRLNKKVEMVDISSDTASLFGKIQIIVANLQNSQEISKKNLFSKPYLSDNQHTLAISRKHPYLLKKINKVITKMQHDGTIDSLKKKWKIDD